MAPEPMSIDDQVYTFYKTKGNSVFLGGTPHRLFEFNKLKWFWKTLGLNRFDLQNCHPEWISQIYLTGMGCDRFESDRIQGNIMPQGVVAEKPTKNGKMQVKKLL